MAPENHPTQEEIEELRKIWQNPGMMPAYHIAQKNLLKKRWPLLWKWMHDHFGD